MHFLIDGYNLLFFHLPPDENLKKNREELISHLDTKLKNLGIEATLIFDSFTEINKKADHQYFEALTVIFSIKGQTADEYILETLSAEKNPNEITVITADKNLAYHCRNLKAHCKSPKSFLKDIAKKQSDAYKKNQSKAHDYEDCRANIERLLSLFEKKLLEAERDF